MYMRWQDKWLIITRGHIEKLETRLKQVGLLQGIDFKVYFPSERSNLLNDLERVFDTAAVLFIGESADVLAKIVLSSDGLG